MDQSALAIPARGDQRSDSAERPAALVSARVGLVLSAALLLVALATPPAHNWDMLPYLSIAAGALQSAPADLPARELAHRQLWRAVAGSTTPARLQELRGAAGNLSGRAARYRQTMAADAQAFHSQLPFYSVKPLYPWLLAVSMAVGAPPVVASVWVTRVAWLGLGFMIFLLIRLQCAELPALGLTIALMALPVMRALGSYSSPDALSNGLIVCALWLLLRHAPIADRQAAAATRGAAPALGCLLIGMLARPDTLLLIGLVVGWLLLHKRRALALAGASAALGCWWWQLNSSGNYGWSTLFYHSFVEYLPYPERFAAPLTWQELAPIYWQQLSATRLFGAVVAAGAAVAALRLYRHGWRDLWGQVCALTVVFMAQHWLLFPDQKDRMLAGCYVVLLVAAATLVNPQRASVTLALPHTRSRQPADLFAAAD